MDEVTFRDLKLSTWILRQLDFLGMSLPTLIQKHCIPEILNGKDCIGAAKTGSGKTLAFALPILQKLSEDPYGIFAVILTPTRELAYQINDTINLIGKPINLRVTVVVGGIEMISQGKELMRKPHIIVGTPGRLCDHLNSCNTFSLKKVKYLVLDEADRLLGGGFDQQITQIFSAMPQKKQMLFFSATMTDTLEKIKMVADREVFQWEQKSDVATVEELDQYYVLCPQYVKDGYTIQTIRIFLEKHQNASVIIFTDTCKNCQLLSMTLKKIGYENVALHGMISQRERLNSLNKFKSNHIKIMVATDVASRGLDIPMVELVLNHSIPSQSKDYIHRVGRTARAGKLGCAISLVTPNDIKLIHSIEEAINAKLKEYKVDGKEVAKIFTQVLVTKREAEIKLDQKDFFEKKAINKRKQMILDGKDPDDVHMDGLKLRNKFRKTKKLAP